MTIDQEKLGAAIRDVRKRRKMTQAELAAEAGLASNSVAILERGERGFSMKTLNALAKALRVPASCLTVLGTDAPTGDPALANLLRRTQDLIATLIAAEERTPRGRPRPKAIQAD